MANGTENEIGKSGSNSHQINTFGKCMNILIVEAHGVMIIVIGNGLDELSSNPGQSCLCFSLYSCLWERHESISTFHLLMGK